MPRLCRMSVDELVCRAMHKCIQVCICPWRGCNCLSRYWVGANKWQFLHTRTESIYRECENGIFWRLVGNVIFGYLLKAASALSWVYIFYLSETSFRISGSFCLCLGGCIENRSLLSSILIILKCQPEQWALHLPSFWGEASPGAGMCRREQSRSFALAAWWEGSPRAKSSSDSWFQPFISNW